MITLLYFAGLKEKTGIEKETLSFSGETVKDLIDMLHSKYEGLSNVVFQVAINEEYALPDDRIHEMDTVALIPPVSGG